MKYTKFHLDKTTKQYKIQIINSLKLITMKKFLFFAASAIALFASCQKTEINYQNGPQEIALFAVNKTVTKAPVEGNVFLNADNMDVVAYISEGDGVATGGSVFFDETAFIYSGDGTTKKWTGGRYWPMSDATLNFLAVTNTGGGVAGKVANAFTVSTSAQSVVSTLTANNVTDQTDLMFAAAQGSHVAGGAYTDVQMTFKHALAWVNFEVATGNFKTVDGVNTVTDADPKITVNSITLNDARVNGVLTVDNPNFAATDASPVTENLDANWSAVATGETADMKLVKSKITTTDEVESYLLTPEYTNFGGNGILVVPSAAKSFTINYTVRQLDGTENTFNYTHDFTAVSWAMSTKYTYQVKLTLTEITITPLVDPWTPAAATEVPLG